MSERYTKVFDLPKNMYAENAPVVISAGALLKDNQTGTILAQLKIKNITNKIIKAAKVSILSFDTVGKQIDDETKHEYLDLSVGRDFEFGQKVPIILSNNSTRSFSVTVNEIIFIDNSIWNYDGEEWAALNEAKKLTSILSGSEAVKQFKLEYGEKCEYEVAEDKDIWICSCGKINKKEEIKCFNCGCFLQTLKNVDLSKLNENKDIRVAKEKEQATQTRAKRNKLIVIISAICIVVIALSIVISNHSKKVNTYNEGVKLLNSDYIDDMSKGVDILLSLRNFKNSTEQIYNRAENLHQNKSTSKSIVLYKKLGNYKDSKDKLNELFYNEGQRLFANNQYLEASKNFAECLNYKDSEEMKQKSLLFNTVFAYDYLNHRNRQYITDLKSSMDNAYDIGGQVLKSMLVGDWLCRATDATLGKKSFSEDAIFTDTTYYPKSKEWSSLYIECKWSVDGDTLKTISTMHYTGDMQKLMKKEYDDLVETFKFVKLTDDVLVSYDPKDGHIEEIYISPNSEIGELCLKQYGIK